MLRNLAAGLAAFAVIIMLIGGWPIVQQRLEYKDHRRVTAELVILKIADPNNPYDPKARALRSTWEHTFDGKEYSTPPAPPPQDLSLLPYNDQLEMGNAVRIVRVALIDPANPATLVWPDRYTFLQYWLVLFSLPLLAMGLVGILYKEPRGYTDVPLPKMGLYELKPCYSPWYRRWAVLVLTLIWCGVAGAFGVDYFVAGSPDNRMGGGIVFGLYFLVGVAMLGYTIYVWWMDLRIRSSKVFVTRCPMLLGLPSDITSDWQFARSMRLASVRIGLLCFAVRRQKRGKWGITMRRRGEPIQHEWNEVLVNKIIKGGERLKLQRTVVVPAGAFSSSRVDQKEEPVYLWYVATHLTFADGPDCERFYPVAVRRDPRIKLSQKVKADGTKAVEGI